MFEAGQAVGWGGTVLVGEFESLPEAHEYALVVLAMNLDCWIKLEAGGGRYGIHVEAAYEAAVRDEFALYEAEQAEVEEKVEPPVFEAGMGWAFLWVCALVTVFMLQDSYPALTDRFCNSSLAVFEGGEWWRPFTALFLHGSFQHLLGNIAIGGIFCVLVAHSVGPALGWGLIMASGLAGNVTTALIHYPQRFSSLGASTATFGALGILVGTGAVLAWRLRSYRKLGGVLVPLAAGGVLLGWWGAGGPQTDVLAHVAGFGFGSVFGVAAYGWQLHRTESDDE